MKYRVAFLAIAAMIAAGCAHAEKSASQPVPIPITESPPTTEPVANNFCPQILYPRAAGHLTRAIIASVDTSDPAKVAAALRRVDPEIARAVPDDADSVEYLRCASIQCLIFSAPGNYDRELTWLVYTADGGFLCVKNTSQDNDAGQLRLIDNPRGGCYWQDYFMFNGTGMHLSTYELGMFKPLGNGMWITQDILSNSATGYVFDAWPLVDSLFPHLFKSALPHPVLEFKLKYSLQFIEQDLTITCRGTVRLGRDAEKTFPGDTIRHIDSVLTFTDQGRLAMPF